MPHAAIVHKLDEPLSVEEVRLRPLQEGEVLVKLAACGVCHSDLSVLNQIFVMPVPIVLGHEAAGEVVEVGPKVTRAGKGDHVVALWRPSCGTCRYCRAGRGHLCKLGDDPTSAAQGRITAGDKPIHQFLGVGGFSEYAILSETAFVKIDKSVPLATAALLGCAVITGYGAATNAAKVKAGDEVCVFGCGGVGLNIIQGAKNAGAKTIIAIDVDDAKLEMAKKFGATHGLNGKTPELPREVKKLTEEKQGVDFAFDAVGNAQLEAVANSCACRGGEVVMVGIDHMKERVQFPQMLAVMQERTYRGSLAGSQSVASTIAEMIRLYQEKSLMLDELVTKRYALRDVNDAIADLRAGKNARGVLVY